MKLLILISICVLNINAFNAPIRSDDDCTILGECLCPSITDTGYEFRCLETLVEVKFDDEIYLQCHDATFSKVLPRLNISYENNIVFYNCPIPTFSFGKLLKTISITNTTAMKFIFFDKTFYRFEMSHFSGLNNLETLSLHQQEYIDPVNNFEGAFDNERNTPTTVIIENDVFNLLGELTRLELDLRINNLPSSSFKNLKYLKYLSISYGQLRVLPETIFDYLSSLENLKLKNNQLENLTENQFGNLKNLQYVNLASNSLKYIPEEVFRNNLQLKRIMMYSNPELSYLPNGLFANNSELLEISLSSCALVNLPYDLFTGSHNLMHLYFRRNQLETLPKTLFFGLTKLLLLDLSSNKIENLPAGLFEYLENLEALHLSKNYLTDLDDNLFSDLRNIKILTLSFNKLTHIPKNLLVRCVKLEIIELNNNDLSHIENSVFTHCVNLQILILSNNYIQSLDSDWFLKVQMKLLDMSFNEIQYIDLSQIVATSQNVIINLENNLITTLDFDDDIDQTPVPTYNNETKIKMLLKGNPLICDCSNFRFFQYLKVAKSAEFDVENLKCVDPQRFLNRSFISLQPQDLTCTFEQLDWKSCSESCECLFRPFDKTIVVDCSNKNLTFAPKISKPNDSFNISEVRLENNQLTAGPVREIGYENVTKLFLSHNKIESLFWLPNELTNLSLDHNHLTYLKKPVIDNFLNDTINLKLGFNPWRCDCDNMHFYSYLISNKVSKQIDIEDIKCENRNITFVSENTAIFCGRPLYHLYGIIATLCCIFMIFISFFWFYYKNKQAIKIWLYSNNTCLCIVKEEEIDKHKTYDAFISFSQKDEVFVETILRPALENDPVNPYKLCLHYRDWPVGPTIPEQIIASVEQSRRTVIVLSPNFINSVWGIMEFKTAHMKSIEERRARMIIILLEDLDENSDLDKDLRDYIKTHTYLKWEDSEFFEKLKYALPHKFTIRDVSS